MEPTARKTRRGSCPSCYAAAHHKGAMTRNFLSLDRTMVQREVRYAQAIWSHCATPVPDALAEEVIADIMT